MKLSTKPPQWPEDQSHVCRRDLRVLHVIEAFGAAGAEQVLVNLLPCLQECGIDCELAVLWPPYELADALRLNHVRVHELDIPSPWSIGEGIPKLKRLILKGSFDVVHAHLPMSVFYAAMSRGNTPLVATFHGLNFQLYPAITLAKKIRRRAERWWTNHRVDAFIAVSGAVADHYHKVLCVPLDRIQVIPNGFPIAALTRDPTLDLRVVRARYEVGAEDFLLVHAGRFRVEKGHVYLLQALSKLRQKGTKFRALLLGSGPLQSQIESSIIQHGLNNEVQLHPPIPHAELRQVLQAADLFVFPSISEGFGMAAGEAMCLGVPVIASNIPGIATLIESGVSGLLVPPADPESLAEAIQRTIDDAELRTHLKDGGSHRIRKYFAGETAAAQIASVYRRTLNRSIKPGA